jgi:hypothetical protein
MTTVDVGVERYASGRYVVGATLKDLAGAEFCLLLFALQETDGKWRTGNARMAAIDRLWPNLGFLFEFSSSPRASDFVALATGTAARSVARVAVAFGDGSTSIEPVADGWVAWIADADFAPPVSVEVMDVAGNVLLTTSYTGPYPGTPPGQGR